MHAQVILGIISCMCIFRVEANCGNCGYSRYRTFTGECNNLNHITWGSSNTDQRRFQLNGKPLQAYQDGKMIPRGGSPTSSSSLPNPRTVTNLISKETLGPSNQLDSKRSAMSFAQGQILAHDIVETQMHDGDIDCCATSNPHGSWQRRTNSGPANDIGVCFAFDAPETGRCMNFVRALPSNNTSLKFREQINKATSYVDASMVYGSTDEQAAKVRVPNSFLLRTSKFDNLPTQPVEFQDFCVRPVKCPFAGDPRVSETPNLQMNHLVWIREHNRIAQKLQKFNRHWSNDIVFQETRRIIIAMWQHIVYNDYLPSVLGTKTAKEYGLLSKKKGYDDNYDPKTDASIRNGFAASAWRFGHSQVVRDQSLLQNDYETITSNKLEDNFNNPQLLQEKKGRNLEDFARFLTFTSSMKIDNFLVDGLRSQLFANSDPPGDLFARNIQRGREHGIPGYNTWREFCGNKKFKKFKKFGDFGKQLKQLYNTTDDVDLLVGGLLETGEDGAVGPTFACIIAKQFQLLKCGDRYWYERNDPIFQFTEEQLKSIKENTLLSKLFCRHFNLELIQKDIFSPGKHKLTKKNKKGKNKKEKKKSNLVECKSLPEIDLKLWKD